MLIPKMLGILGEGPGRSPGPLTAIIDADIELGGYVLGFAALASMHTRAQGHYLGPRYFRHTSVIDRSLTLPTSLTGKGVAVF